MNKRPEWQLPVFVTFLFLGILLSVQFRTQQNYLNTLTAQSTEDLVAMVRDFYEKKATLLSELGELTYQKQAFEQGLNNGQSSVKNLVRETTRLKTVLGASPAEGPGITITITNDSPIVYLDLIDIVNELWTSGAEAITVNGVRVTFGTSIYYGEDDSLYITLNAQRLNFPIIIQAVGDPQALESGLKLTGGVMDDLAVFKAYPQIRQVEHLLVPGVREMTGFKYARPD